MPNWTTIEHRVKVMTSSAEATSATEPKTRSVKVWDIFVHVFHWAVAVAFYIAYFTEDDLLTIHVWAG